MFNFRSRIPKQIMTKDCCSPTSRGSKNGCSPTSRGSKDCCSSTWRGWKGTSHRATGTFVVKIYQYAVTKQHIVIDGSNELNNYSVIIRRYIMNSGVYLLYNYDMMKVTMRWYASNNYQCLWSSKWRYQRRDSAKHASLVCSTHEGNNKHPLHGQHIKSVKNLCGNNEAKRGLLAMRVASKHGRVCNYNKVPPETERPLKHLVGDASYIYVRPWYPQNNTTYINCVYYLQPVEYTVRGLVIKC